MQSDTKIIRQLVRGIALVAIVIVCVGVFNIITLRFATSTYAQREQDNHILNQTQSMHTAMLGIVSGTRGFIISGQNSYLTTVDHSIGDFEKALEELQRLTTGNSVQQRRLELIKTNYETLVFDLETPLIEYRSNFREGEYSPELIQFFLDVSTKGRYLTDEILRLIRGIEQAEGESLAISEKRLQVVVKVTNSANMTGTLVILMLLVLITRFNIRKLKNYQAERSSYEAKLQRASDRLTAVIEGTHSGTWEWDIATGHLMVNERWASMLGYSLAELEPISIHSLDDRADPEDSGLARIRREQVIADDMEFYDVDIRMRHKDGQVVWVHDRGKVVRSSDSGQPLVMAGTRTDITQRKQLQELIDLERERLKATLQAVPDGVLATDVEGKVVMMNRVAEQLTGWTQTEAAGRAFGEICKFAQGQEEQTFTDYCALVFGQGAPLPLPDDSILYCRDGSSVFVAGAVSPIFTGKGQVDGTVMVFSDITEKKVKEDEYVRLSYRDPLTGLHNRRYYDQKREELDAEGFYPLAVVSADVDGLKLTNDAFGHEMGDRLLELVGETFRNLCRKHDVVARVGGDEFILLLPGTTMAQAALMVERLSKSLQAARNRDLAVSVSFGFAIKEDPSIPLADVEKQAEDNMYLLKSVESPKMKKRTVDMLLDAQFQKDPWEYEHCMAVSSYVDRFARLLGFSDDDVLEMKTAGIYHDIGKIAIDSQVLCKTSALDEKEWDTVRRHAELSYSILRSVNAYAPFAQYVQHHHERWDGHGYPHGLAGEAIPLRARMLTVVDAYVAMVSDRPYRQARSVDFAVEELHACAGSQFDPKLARSFVEHILNRPWV